MKITTPLDNETSVKLGGSFTIQCVASYSAIVRWELNGACINESSNVIITPSRDNRQRTVTSLLTVMNADADYVGRFVCRQEGDFFNFDDIEISLSPYNSGNRDIFIKFQGGRGFEILDLLKKLWTFQYAARFRGPGILIKSSTIVDLSVCAAWLRGPDISQNIQFWIWKMPIESVKSIPVFAVKSFYNRCSLAYLFSYDADH